MIIVVVIRIVFILVLLSPLIFQPERVWLVESAGFARFLPLLDGHSLGHLRHRGRTRELPHLGIRTAKRNVAHDKRAVDGRVRITPGDGRKFQGGFSRPLDPTCLVRLQASIVRSPPPFLAVCDKLQRDTVQPPPFRSFEQIVSSPPDVWRGMRSLGPHLSVFWP